MAGTAAVIALFLFLEIKPYLHEKAEPEKPLYVQNRIDVVEKQIEIPAKEQEQALPLPTKKAMAAIIIDDVGLKIKPIEQLLELDIPLTFSILPDQPHSTELAEKIHNAGREVMLHLPMEPEDKAHNNPGRSALLVSLSEMEIRRSVRNLIERTPHVAGMNNHMGSLFTKNGYLIKVVLDEVKKADIFFIDSLTAPESVAFQTAREMGIKSGKRLLFLDNERNSENIKTELRHTISLALKKGEVIVIGHPYAETIEAIAGMKDEFASAGVELVHASKLVH